MKSKSLVLLLASMLALTGCAGAGENPEGGGTTPEEQHEKESEIVLISISVKTQPSKKEYKEGETFDPTGMVVEATYSDGTAKEVTNYQISNQALTVSTTSINILYEGKTAQVDITVNPLPTYVVTFMASESEKIEDVTYKEGATPSYSYSVPSTAQYEYEFLGWSLTPNGDVLSELPKVTQNATYYAKIQQKTRKYSIIFKNEAGSVLQNSEVEYGTKPEAPEYNPTDTAQYDYSFVGWATSQGGEVLASLPEVTGEATYFAIVSSTVRSYTIKFVDEDGDEIQSNTLEYGATPTCDYEVEDTAEWDYTTKWSKTAGGSAIASFPLVTGNATYYAIVTKEKQKYDIKFLNEDGSAYKTVSDVEYGTVPTVTSPTKTADQQYTYSFAGWSLTEGGEVLSSLPAVIGEATYYAIFGKTVNKYSITLKLNNGENDVVVSDYYGTSYDDFKSYEPTKEGYKFTKWYSDSSLTTPVQFPVTLTQDATYYAGFREKIDMVECLKELLTINNTDPYSFIPETMRSTYAENGVDINSIPDYSTQSVNVSNINTTGFGEQWKMILDNIDQSEKFYLALTAGDNSLTNAIGIAINYFTDFEDETSDSSDNGTISYSCEYKNGTFYMNIEFLEDVETPFGILKPVINLTCTPSTGEKTIFINIDENNAMKCLISDSAYIFGIKYGATISGKSVIRSAYCELRRPIEDDDSYVVGHIGEFVSYINDESSKELISSAADFYISEKRVFAIGNKASGLIGFEGTILESYDVETGTLLGSMVSEKKDLEFIGIDLGEVEYHTFWLNLEVINGISSVKAIKKEGVVKPNENPHEIYVNGSDSIFEPEKNVAKLVFKTSREYDIEMRAHYYIDNNGGLAKKEVPMMFIQDDDGYYDNGYNNTDFSDFDKNIVKVSKVNDGGLSDDARSIAGEIRYYWLGDNQQASLKETFDTNKLIITPETIDNWLK